MHWKGPYYKATITYIAVLVTTILSMQIYRFFVSAPADEIKCQHRVTALMYIPVTGVLFDG